MSEQNQGPKQRRAEDPLVAVVIPVYNVATTLDRCLQSVVGQTYPHLEVILVDDGATDESGGMCDDWAARDGRLRVIHKPNGGLSDARNAGIAQVTAPYTTFVDSDDYLEPDAIERLVRNLQETGADLSVVGVRDCFPNRSEAPDPRPRRTMSAEQALGDIFINETMMVGAYARLYPTWLTREVPFPKGRIHEDAFVVVDLFSRVGTVVADTAPGYNYWHNAGTITSAAYTPKDLDLIEAWDANQAKVARLYPALAPNAEYRCLRARFEVLDKMVLSRDVDPAAKRAVIGYLKAHRKAADANPYLQRARKFSIAALCVGEGCYRSLVKLNNRRRSVY